MGAGTVSHTFHFGSFSVTPKRLVSETIGYGPTPPESWQYLTQSRPVVDQLWVCPAQLRCCRENAFPCLTAGPEAVIYSSVILSRIVRMVTGEGRSDEQDIQEAGARKRTMHGLT